LLLEKDESTKSTLHFDSTRRSRIDGEWPSLVLNFKNDKPADCHMIRLRPLFFAYEDRDQITKLIVETFFRLAVTQKTTAKALWEKVNAFMTDAATKNLKVEMEVSKELKTNYAPLHLLCKSHTCDKFDECNVKTLSQIESKIKLREQIEKGNHSLNPFSVQKNLWLLMSSFLPSLN